MDFYPIKLTCYIIPLQDLPFDPTGELESLRSFIEDNIDICKWVGIAVIGIQVCCSCSDDFIALFITA